MKKLFAFAIMALATLGTVNAQTISLDSKSGPHMFIGLQGGAQTTFTNFDQMKLVTPTASVSLGAFFTPVVGARIHANGMWNKGGIKPDFKYNYKYVTTDLDLLINLTTLFGSRDYYPLNFYLIGGAGLTAAWDNKDLTNSAYAANLPFAWQKNRLSHNARAGFMVDYNLSKNLSINLEVDANSLSDRYNSKTSAKDDWQMTAQIGLAFNFGYKKASSESQRSERAAAAARKAAQEKAAKKDVADAAAAAAGAAALVGAGAAAAAADAATPLTAQKAAEKTATAAAATTQAKAEPSKPVVKPEMRTEFFYEIRETVIAPSEKAKFNQLVKFLKENPDTKVSVVGYADAGTGNDQLNARYASERAQNVVKALKAAGIDGKRITSDSKGDDIQPYRENDKNRVVIAVAK